MCTIMCYAGKDIEMEKFEEALKRTESRGPDMTKILTLPSGIFGFQRLSIMDLSATVSASVCAAMTYRFIKTKNKEHLFIAIIMLTVAIMATVRFFMGH